MHKIINFTRGGALYHLSTTPPPTEHSPLPFPLDRYSTKHLSRSLSLLPSYNQDHDSTTSLMHSELATYLGVYSPLRMHRQGLRSITPPTSCNIVAMYTTFDPLLPQQTSAIHYGSN